MNRNLTCRPHVDANGCPSWIAFFGKFTGGELCSGTFPQATWTAGGPTEHRVWIPFDGRDEHWNLPHTGDKLSVVAYPKPPLHPRQSHAAAARRAGGYVLAVCAHRRFGWGRQEYWTCETAGSPPAEYDSCHLTRQATELRAAPPVRAAGVEDPPAGWCGHCQEPLGLCE